MAEFLVELYVAHGDDSGAWQRADRATRVGAELSVEGRSARCVRSIFVPEDETCFLLYEASSVDAVAEAVRRAGLRPEHISLASSAFTTQQPAGSPAAPDPKGITMTSTTHDHAELRDKQQKVWSSGD